MFGCVVDLDLLANAPGFLRFKGLVERGKIMRVEVIQHQDDLLRIRVLDINEVAKDLGKILLRAMRAHRHMPLARQWLKAHEEVTRALSLLFVVKALDLPRFGWDGHPCRTSQLLARFVQTDLRMPCIIGACVDVQHLFHLAHKGGIRFRRNTILFFEPGLELVFFSTWRTVSRPTRST